MQDMSCSTATCMQEVWAQQRAQHGALPGAAAAQSPMPARAAQPAAPCSAAPAPPAGAAHAPSSRSLRACIKGWCHTVTAVLNEMEKKERRAGIARCPPLPLAPPSSRGPPGARRHPSARQRGGFRGGFIPFIVGAVHHHGLQAQGKRRGHNSKRRHGSGGASQALGEQGAAAGRPRVLSPPTKKSLRGTAAQQQARPINRSISNTSRLPAPGTRQ